MSRFDTNERRFHERSDGGGSFVHAHVHTHEDGTVHNHYHSHPGGSLPHGHDCRESSDKFYGNVTASACADSISEGHDLAASNPPVHTHALCEQDRVSIHADSVSYSYKGAEEFVFEGVSLSGEAGMVLGILGNNGAGKSTLLNILAGIEEPCSGIVRVGDSSLKNLGRKEIARHIAYVAQQQQVPRLSVYDQVLLGRRPYVNWSLSDYDRLVVARTISQLGLEAYSSRYLDELSGGERQKVYIARALAQEPEVLLLDEPTSALDPRNQTEVMQLIREVTREASIATIMVIHDINLALRFCDRFMLMRNGRVVAFGDSFVVTEDSLQETYGIEFALGDVKGTPVAIPLG